MKSKAALCKLALAVVEFQRQRPLAASKLFADAADDKDLAAELERITSSDVGVVPSETGEEFRELPKENPGGREVQAAGDDERVEVKGSGDEERIEVQSSGEDERVEVKAGANGWTYDESDASFSGEATLSREQDDKQFYVVFLPKEAYGEQDCLEVGYFSNEDPTNRSDDSYDHVNADDKLTDEDIKKAEELLKKFGCAAMPDRSSWNSLLGRLELSSKRPSLFKASGDNERVEVKSEFRDEIDPLDEMATNQDEMPPSKEEASMRARNRLARSMANIQAMARRTATAAKK